MIIGLAPGSSLTADPPESSTLQPDTAYTITSDGRLGREIRRQVAELEAVGQEQAIAEEEAIAVS